MQFASSCYQSCWLDTLDLGGDTNVITLSPSCNLWQIGANQKPEFGTPGNDVGIETDLDSAYPVNSSCSFWVKFPNLLQWPSYILLFEHKYSADSLNDGGTIEYSCNGTDWSNVVGNISGGFPAMKNFLSFPMVQDYGGYYDQGSIPTLDDVNYAFTGSNTSWHWSGVQIIWFMPVKSAQNSLDGCDMNGNDSVQFRFSFTSDSTFDNQPGWMIRNVVVGSADIAGGIADVYNTSARIYPNPSSKLLFIKEGIPQAKVSIVNLLGQEQMNTFYSQNGLDISSLASGMYWVKFESSAGIQVSKFTKE